MVYQEIVSPEVEARRPRTLRDTVSTVVDVLTLQKRITSKAVDFAQDGNLEKAIETLELGLDQYSDNLYFLGQLGQLYRRGGYLEDAQECLERSHELKPSDIRTITSLAGVYSELGMYDEAEAMLAKARRLDCNDKFVVVTLAKLLGERGRYQEAADLLETSGGIEGGNKFVIASYGIVEVLLGNRDKARAALEKGYQMHPRDPYIINLLGNIRAETGDYAGAEDVLIAGNRMDNRNRHICTSLASVYARQKKYHEAELVLLAGRRFNSSDVALINTLGNVYAQIGEFERAESTLMDARRIDPRNLPVITTLGHTFLKAGQFARFETLIEQTKTLGADDDCYAYLVAKGAFLQGKWAEARLACRDLLLLRGLDTQGAVLYMACAEEDDAMLESFRSEFGERSLADLKQRALELKANPRQLDLYDPKFCGEELPAFMIENERQGGRKAPKAAMLLIGGLLAGGASYVLSSGSGASLAEAGFLGGAPQNVWMTILLALCCCLPDAPQSRRIRWALRD